MTASWVAVFCGLSAMACALVSGVFLTFSDFVMRALAKAEPAAGMEAMQIINREVFRTVFMVLLIGMSALSVAGVAFAYFTLSGLSALSVIWAGSIYFVGVFGVTLLFNIPLNSRLDRQVHTNADAQAFWKLEFYPRWTMWNHVRTIAAGTAAVGYGLGCISLVHAA